MTTGHAPAIWEDSIERCLTRVNRHFERLAGGHDPFGHLFAIERLARAARSDWSEAERRAAGT